MPTAQRATIVARSRPNCNMSSPPETRHLEPEQRSVGADSRDCWACWLTRTDDLLFVKRIYGRASPRWSTSPVQDDYAHGFCLSMCVSTTPIMCGQLVVI